MSRHFWAFNLVAVIVIASLLFGYMIYIKKEREEIEQLKLSYAVDYASDAAAMAMLKTGSLEMDYSKSKSVTVDPQLALDTFLEVFCFNYNLQPTKDNMALIKDYIPAAVVAGYDGYYLASQQLVKNGGGNYPETDLYNGEWDVVFGMKIPYIYNYNSVKYALNMGLDSTIALSGTNMTRLQGLPPTSAGTMSQTDARALINDIVSNKMANTINQVNVDNPNWKNSFFIPSRLTNLKGVNPIEGPSFIILVQGVTLTTSRPISGFSVAGSRIDAARMVVGYTAKNGMKYYAYADHAPPSVEEDPVNGVKVEALFANLREAASAGYYFDPNYIN